MLSVAPFIPKENTINFALYSSLALMGCLNVPALASPSSKYILAASAILVAALCFTLSVSLSTNSFASTIDLISS